MITSLRNSPSSKHSRSSLVTPNPPLVGGGGYTINLKKVKLKLKHTDSKNPSIKEICYMEQYSVFNNHNVE